MNEELKDKMIVSHGESGKQRSKSLLSSGNFLSNLGEKENMKWQHQRSESQGIQIDINKRILRYDPKKYMVRFAGTEKDPQLFIYSLVKP